MDGDVYALDVNVKRDEPSKSRTSDFTQAGLINSRKEEKKLTVFRSSFSLLFSIFKPPENHLGTVGRQNGFLLQLFFGRGLQ
jgi:hypothetical protein